MARSARPRRAASSEAVPPWRSRSRSRACAASRVDWWASSCRARSPRASRSAAACRSTSARRSSAVGSSASAARIRVALSAASRARVRSSTAASTSDRNARTPATRTAAERVNCDCAARAAAVCTGRMERSRSNTTASRAAASLAARAAVRAASRDAIPKSSRRMTSRSRGVDCRNCANRPCANSTALVNAWKPMPTRSTIRAPTAAAPATWSVTSPRSAVSSSRRCVGSGAPRPRRRVTRQMPVPVLNVRRTSPCSAPSVNSSRGPDCSGVRP